MRAEGQENDMSSPTRSTKNLCEHYILGDFDFNELDDYKIEEQCQ